MIADVLYAFEDAPDRVVGIGRINQGRGNSLPAIDPDYDNKSVLAYNIGPEQIAAENPDLVIMKTFMREAVGRRGETLGIPLIYVELETPQQYQRDIMMLGTVLNEPERARELTQWYSRQVAGVEDQTRLLTERPAPGHCSYTTVAATAKSPFRYLLPPGYRRNWLSAPAVSPSGALPRKMAEGLSPSSRSPPGTRMRLCWSPMTVTPKRSLTTWPPSRGGRSFSRFGKTAFTRSP